MGISVGNAIPAGFSERSETKQAAYYAAEVRKLIVLRLFGFILASSLSLQKTNPADNFKISLCTKYVFDILHCNAAVIHGYSYRRSRLRICFLKIICQRCKAAPLCLLNFIRPVKIIHPSCTVLQGHFHEPSLAERIGCYQRRLSNYLRIESHQ